MTIKQMVLAAKPLAPEKQAAIVEKWKADVAANQALFKTFLKSVMSAHGLKVVPYHDQVYGAVKVIVDPVKWAEKETLKGAIIIEWQTLSTAKGRAQYGEGTNTYPSMRGLQVNDKMYTTLHSSPEWNDTTHPRNKTSLKKFAEYIPQFLEYIPKSRYQHSGD